MQRRMPVLSGSAEDATILMEQVQDASAFEVSADAAEVWRARRPPRQDPHSAEQVAMDHLKGISEICLMDKCAAFVWVQSDSAAVATFISTLLAAELLCTARTPAFIKWS